LASVGARAWLRLARRLGAIGLIDTIDFVSAIGFVWRVAIDFVRRGERRSPRTRHASGTGYTSTRVAKEPRVQTSRNIIGLAARNVPGFHRFGDFLIASPIGS
jgi:hypothetical protein